MGFATPASIAARHDTGSPYVCRHRYAMATGYAPGLLRGHGHSAGALP